MMMAYPDRCSEQNNAYVSAVTGKATGTTICFCGVFVAIFYFLLLRKEFRLNFVSKVLTKISVNLSVKLM
jgi:hypothetical protein